MGTLSSFNFSLILPNGCNFRDKFRNNSTKCFLCGEILLKRRRRLILKGDFTDLNSVIRSRYNGESNRSDDSSSSSNGERESQENPNSATMSPAEKKSDDNSVDRPASVSSRPSTISSIGPAYSNFQVDSFKLMELLGPEKVDPADVKVIKDKLFGYSTFWVSRLPTEVVKYFTDPNAVEPPDMRLLLPFVDSALPLAYGVLGVQLFHEVGHFLAAFPRKVKLSIPYFIPNITLGSFGAITRFKSILPDGKAKVDISLAGPFAGAAFSFSMFAVGLLLSSNPSVAGDLIQVIQLVLFSATAGLFRTMHAATISIHPLVIAGCCGLTTSAFNMLPVGCLDGGRAMQGAFGKNALIASGLATYTLLGLGVLGGPLSLPWGLYVLICQRTPEKSCLNDVTEIETWRKAIFELGIDLVTSL